jgi:hypothetical protein
MMPLRSRGGLDSAVLLARVQWDMGARWATFVVAPPGFRAFICVSADF